MTDGPFVARRSTPSTSAGASASADAPAAARPPSERDHALIAILAGLLWSIGAIDLNEPQTVRIVLLVAGFLAVALHLSGARTGALAGAYAVAIAAAERLARTPLENGSDVVRATREAIEVVLAGGNPYTHVMQSTVPVGSPFVYPPGEFLFYLPAYLVAGDITRVEIWVGIATTAAIALAGLAVGWERASLPAMLYGTWGIAAFRTVDGGNDVAAAFLVVVALVLLALPGRAAFVASALAFGWALAFKQFALLVLPAVLRHLAAARAPWRGYAAVALGLAALMTLPFLVMDPGAFLGQQVAALTFHEEVWGANLLHALRFRGADVEGVVGLFFALELALTVGAIALVATIVRVPTIGAAALIACAVVAIPLLFARWTTQSYYVYAVTIGLAGWAVLNVTAAGYQSGTRRRENVPKIDPEAS